MAKTSFQLVDGEKKGKNVIAPKRRRLTDLYVVGKEVVFDDGVEGEEPITVWLSKISPLENRDSADTASSVRAKILSLKNAPDADERLLAVYKEQLEDLGVKDHDSMVEFLISPKVQEAFLSVESRLSEEEPWVTDNYLNSLQQAWNDGLAEKYAIDDEHEDALRVYNELKRFTDLVVAEVEEEKENLAAEYDHESDEDLYRLCLERTIDAEADFAWVNEFSRWQIFYAVREPDNHKQRYFEMREEVDALDVVVLNKLLAEYRELTVDPQEGKG
jgi:hypothetical protein